MIRPDLLRALYDCLESHKYLAPEDFVVAEYTSSSNVPCLGITYRYAKDLYFKFSIPDKKTTKHLSGEEAYRFSCIMRPGREAVEESLGLEERSGLLAELKDWLKRLHADVISAPVARQFQEHGRVVEEIRQRLDALPDEPISADDAVALKKGLEGLKLEVLEELKQQAEDKDELRKKIEQLTRDIDFLKSTLESTTKKKWGELLFTRMQGWKSKLSLRRIAAGTRAAGLLIPGSEHLGTVADALDALASGDEKQSKAPSREG